MNATPNTSASAVTRFEVFQKIGNLRWKLLGTISDPASRFKPEQNLQFRKDGKAFKLTKAGLVEA